jgi:hypothetical protein
VSAPKVKNGKLLVVVDELAATTHALEYVARIIAGRLNIRVCLAHSLEQRNEHVHP